MYDSYFKVASIFIFKKIICSRWPHKIMWRAEIGPQALSLHMVYTETQPWSFQIKLEFAAFSKVFVFEGRILWSRVIDRHNHSKSYVF